MSEPDVNSRGLAWRAGCLQGAASSFYALDQVGSVRALTDASQATTDAYAYDAFGNQLAVTGTTPNPYRYVGALGYCSNGASGLLQVGARYYAPDVGRFITADPIGYAGGLNVYRYAGANPVSRVDPLGLRFTELSEAQKKLVDKALVHIEESGVLTPEDLKRLKDLMARGKIGVDPDLPSGVHGEYYCGGKIALNPGTCLSSADQPAPKKGPAGGAALAALQHAALVDQYFTEATLIHELQHSHQFFLWRFWFKGRNEDAAYKSARNYLEKRLEAETDPVKKRALEEALDMYPKDYEDSQGG